MHLGRDWLSTQSAVAGVTFMNEFAPYAMQALPLKRRTRQTLTEFDYNRFASFDIHSHWMVIQDFERSKFAESFAEKIKSNELDAHKNGAAPSGKFSSA